MPGDTFTVNSRKIKGKKTRFLRRNGITPANLFGQGIESTAVQAPTDKLLQIISEKGTTRLIDLSIDSETETRSVFIGEIQRDALSGELIHVDFYQVNKNRKIKVSVPVVLLGEAPAAKLKNIFIEHLVSELEVESLPGDLPPQIEVDISNLSDIDQSIRVEDINVSEGVEIMADPEILIVKVSTIAEEKEEVPVAPEAVVTTEAPPVAEAAPGQKTAP
jgi:large subunit ribosomal protein L25